MSTGDFGKTLNGTAFKDTTHTSPYNLDTEITKLELYLTPPINGIPIGPLQGIVTNPGSGGNEFHWKDPSNTMNVEGYWTVEVVAFLTTGEEISLGTTTIYSNESQNRAGLAIPIVLGIDASTPLGLGV